MAIKKPKLFYCELYMENFYFLPGWKAEEVEEKYETRIKNAQGKVFVIDTGVVIWIKAFDIKNLEFLHHECIHAANFVLEDKGIKITTKNDEALTYLSQFIFKNCMKHFRQKK